MSRSHIPDRELKLLFLYSGNVCAFPACDKSLVEPGTLEDRPAVIGDTAHIVASSRQGPRGEDPLSDEDRDKYENLILLCTEHHTIVDTQLNTYSVAVLRQMKTDHERRIAQRLRPTEPKPTTPTITESLYSTLLGLRQLPGVIFSAPSKYTDAQYEEAKQQVQRSRHLTPFLLKDGRLYTFYDLRRRHPFHKLTCGDARTMPASEWWGDGEGSRRYKTLLNRGMHKYAGRREVRYDPNHLRYYFPPRKPGEARTENYTLRSGRTSTRSVAWRPVTRKTQEPKNYWQHLAARLTFMEAADLQWCLSIRPERHLTADGETPLPSSRIGRRVTRLKARMYNEAYLDEVHFWLSYLSGGKPRLLFDFGGQATVVDASLLSFAITWPAIHGDEPGKATQPFEDDLFSLADLDDALTGDGGLQDVQTDEDEIEEEDDDE
jgi:hypothetical protein